jgi:uncharacterized protein YndB with AHSA1/START domain
MKEESRMSTMQIVAKPGSQEIRFTRLFDAPRELVYRAWTDPGMIARWMGPRHLTTTVVEMDARPGGLWRFVHRDPDGREFGFHGVHHDVAPCERLVRTFEFEGMPGHVSLETLTLEEAGGRTRVVGQSVFQSVEDRDGAVSSGMEAGMAEGFDRLDELLRDAR